MGNISSVYHSSSSAADSPNPSSPSSDPLRDPASLPDGYASDDLTHASRSTICQAERKKGLAWTEEEHMMFLVGLQKLGKGDWKGISRNYVTSRTPTQVASHAQKYFIRHCNVTRRKRRSSLFDMVPHDMATESQSPEQLMLPPPALETEEAELVAPGQGDSSPSVHLSLSTDFESMETTLKNDNNAITPSTTEASSVFPTFIATYIPMPFPIWPSNAVPLDEEDAGAETSHHQILKPIPVVPKEPLKLDELVGMSRRLSLGDNQTGSLKLAGEPSRPSAFHHASSQL